MRYNIMIETWDIPVDDDLIDEIMALDLDWEMIQTDFWDHDRIVLMGCSHIPEPVPFYMSVVR